MLPPQDIKPKRAIWYVTAGATTEEEELPGGGGVQLGHPPGRPTPPVNPQGRELPWRTRRGSHQQRETITRVRTALQLGNISRGTRKKSRVCDTARSQGQGI